MYLDFQTTKPGENVPFFYATKVVTISKLDFLTIFQ